MKNELLHIPNLVDTLSCKLIDKLIEIAVKFFMEQSLSVKKEFLVMAFFHYKLIGRDSSKQKRQFYI